MEKSPQPLRVLMIVNLPWDSRLGASRVWMELAEQWRAAGHVVDKYSFSDAFPGANATRITFAIRQLIFVRKAAAFVRKNGHRFDIIDALIGTLPYSKDELGFRGLIVARSVGLFRLYERFERSVAERWPRPRRGKFAGRLLYGFTRRRLLQASERSVASADLINVPNEEEAGCLREELRVNAPVIVQPYGLTEARRKAFAEAAQAPEARLAQKRICFIGMWSPRKGAHDWAEIIRRVREQVPDAQFRFLGTMLDAESVRADLGAAAEGVELISDFQPEELPALLADCTVGAFPSYVEGFGLAVLEQMAAGLPTVAYDTAGPRDILAPSLTHLLVPSGDTASFAATLVRILRLDLPAYGELSQQSVAASATFSSPKIADATLTSYRRFLDDAARPILFVQSFSVGYSGGGARILRALLEPAPLPWQSVVCDFEKPKPWRDEVYVRTRPSWGRVEYSRLAALPKMSGAFFQRRFRKRLRECVLRLGARAIHSVPHGGLEFATVQAVACELALPFFISLHDDLAYTAPRHLPVEKREAAMSQAWREAAGRFVISEALGQEYCRRYGARDYQIVTDGLTGLTPPSTNSRPGTLRVYFMGLFHMVYERNLRALLEGIALFEREHPSIEVTVTMRCEHVRPQVLAGTKEVTILPFADEAQVQRDLQNADLLYMPLPFEAQDENFVRYSLSTKMVTYLGSGLPILYHGPQGSAAFDLLTKHNAALALTTLVPAEVAAVLTEATPETRATVAAHALDLAQREFMLADQVRKFWDPIVQKLGAA